MGAGCYKNRNEWVALRAGMEPSRRTARRAYVWRGVMNLLVLKRPR